MKRTAKALSALLGYPDADLQAAVPEIRAAFETEGALGAREQRALEPLLAQAQLWVHGHLHCQHDYVEQGCRVVANTLGYAAKGEQADFREDRLVEVPAIGAAC